MLDHQLDSTRLNEIYVLIVFRLVYAFRVGVAPKNLVRFRVIHFTTQKKKVVLEHIHISVFYYTISVSTSCLGESPLLFWLNLEDLKRPHLPEECYCSQRSVIVASRLRLL